MNDKDSQIVQRAERALDIFCKQRPAYTTGDIATLRSHLVSSMSAARIGDRETALDHLRAAERLNLQTLNLSWKLAGRNGVAWRAFSHVRKAVRVLVNHTIPHPITSTSTQEATQ